MDKTKPYIISKKVVYEAFLRVKANKGSAGIDQESIEEFEVSLKDNLYKLWNRMSSGCYFPPAVKAVEIPKKAGGTRTLGIPTLTDRIAQMVVKLYFEPSVEPFFHEDSYGYRPNKSPIQALEITRKRCWKYNWVLEFDIKGLFDNIDHGLLMKAVEKHTNIKWVKLYIERWLKAPFQTKEGVKERTSGTPQGGVISPVLANLFLHYTFDKWMNINHPNNPFARYADDAVIHCKSEAEAIRLLESLSKRMNECKLELHPTKTRIVYCKDDDRKENHENISFDFLGYTFRPRRSKNRWGKHFINFTPAISNKSKKSIRQKVRDWKLQLKVEKDLTDLSNMFNSKIIGWINFYGKFYKSEMYSTLRHINKALIMWARKKYKRLARHKKRAEYFLGRIANQNPKFFKHWELGIKPTAE
ncbi:group II intron reverse transcriptase/maturase [Cytobacillus firmus]|uniref:group II intron reverse transcriptase/maturase n=1 Tax=Cytobacillus firmus TaxID=1399 RepID=UPI0018CF8451|nr:group II intron reverse transcriptase/maturase [Cytobacillus firmus]MBG9654169.1 DNA polymerase [Cytobacillus firmus]MBG9655000.1 DNA polymerase [Cytobacillus firmus]MBG9655513.1 DNA polymerase [Cytobacillus firmus]MBG9657529.1 DNA polymerase [Cytobacillus firmus]MED1908981.1 group II intron reverse transcriptase/maturase [Cytobacillus firmus]